MSLLLAWLVFPAVMTVLCLGCGLLADRAAGRGTVEGALLAPTGLVTIIVIAGLLTMQSSTARAAIPACATASVAGFALNHARLRSARAGGWLIAAAIAVFVAYGAPILFTGTASFAGYIKLDDSSTWMAMTDRAMTHGRDLSGVAPSTYYATLSYALASGYPLGSLLPWGVGRALVGEDLAWILQPYLAFLGALFAMTAFALLRPFFRRRWTLALATFVVAQPALLYAYSLWGGIKEMTAAVCIALTAALVPSLLAANRTAAVRRVIPIAAASAATLVTLTVGGALWLVIALGGALVVLARQAGRRWTLVSAAGFVVLGAAFAGPALKTAGYVLRSNGGLTEQASGSAPAPDQIATALGNLIRPLRAGQVFGIWPASDFRTAANAPGLTTALIVLLAVIAVLGFVYAVRRRAWGPVLYGGTAAVGCLVITHYGSPWVDAKALATASPAALLLAAAAIGVLLDRVHFAIPLCLAAAIAAGVVWSNVLAYGGVNVAPRSQLHELQVIGQQFAGQGPTLVNEYQPYGVRHFLRHADAEAPSELRIRPVFLVRGGYLSKAGYADIDEFLYASLTPYRTLVLRRSPAASRPPSSYKLVRRGHYYDVWQVDPSAPLVLAHTGLGNPVEATGIPDCNVVKRLATLAGPSGRLATVFRAPTVTAPLNVFSHPPAWTDPSGGDLLPGSSGTATGTVYVANPGTYDVWLGGSVRSPLTVTVDGQRLATARNQLNVAGQWIDFGTVPLGPGNHRIELQASGPDLAPGSGGLAPPVGPVALSLGADDAGVTYLPSSEAHSLCGHAVDWVEAVR